MKNKWFVILAISSAFFVVFWVGLGPRRVPETGGAKATPGALAQASPAAVAVEVKKNQREMRIFTGAEFEALCLEVQQRLPTREDLKKLTAEEAHGLPEPIQKAGHDLWKIAQALHDNPGLKSNAAQFYRKCAANSESPTSVRALCYANLKALSDVTEADYPDDVRQLSEQIPANGS